MDYNVKSTIDIARSVIDLQDKKSELILRKQELEVKLSESKNRIRSNGGRPLPDAEYHAICRNQDQMKRAKSVIEAEISQVKAEIRKKEVLREEVKREIKTYSSDTIFGMLTEIKDHYINFAADKSRVSSMRAMAAEFAERIESVLKQSQ